MASTRAPSPAGDDSSYPRRVNIACTFCRNKKIKCPNNDAQGPCEECVRRNLDCTFIPASGESGTPPRHYPAARNLPPSPQPIQPAQPAHLDPPTRETLPYNLYTGRQMIRFTEGLYPSRPMANRLTVDTTNSHQMAGAQHSSTPPSSSSVGAYDPVSFGPDTVPRAVSSGGEPIVGFLEQQGTWDASNDMALAGPSYAGEGYDPSTQVQGSGDYYLTTFPDTYPSN
ncbi:hypothetical protein BDN72DRAFT_360433 [Pluteus cervinus]|uniref:Uncharacterized protein n=1 Tax=Pluteus cervinus TaxID=181527 RepID=A0ACD3BCD0_9AGAR|nr:hypothetical protein BDN72DRAFT_360433 [Pluteus cervinus]